MSHRLSRRTAAAKERSEVIVRSLEWQTQCVIVLDVLLWFIGAVMFGLAWSHQTAQIAVPLYIWLMLHTIATLVSIVATAWFVVLLETKTKLQHNRLLSVMMANGMFLLLGAQMVMYAYLLTRIAFIYHYAGQNPEFLQLVDQGVRLSGSPPCFLERLLDKYLDMITWTNALLSVVVGAFYFVQCRAFDPKKALMRAVDGALGTHTSFDL
jgi:hypothetical protein